jgi:hypothetical protein
MLVTTYLFIFAATFLGTFVALRYGLERLMDYLGRSNG